MKATSKARVTALAKKIKLIAMDVDGVLTGGEIVVLNSGEEMKIWNVKDGLGFYLARRSGAGLRFAWITGRESRQVADRAREMKIDYLYQNCMSKREALDRILADFGVTLEQTAYIGDDVVDVPVLKCVGLAVTPSDGCLEAKRAADHVTSCPGGRGVLREVVELVLRSQGHWKKACEGYI